MSWERESLESRFDDMLDECYEPFTMGDLIFMPSDILKSCDPVAYRVGLCEFEDFEDEEEEEEPETHPRNEHDLGLSCDLCEDADDDPFEDLDTYTRDADWEMEERGL